MTNYVLEIFAIEGRYEDFIGKPYSSRKPLTPDREAIVGSYLAKIQAGYEPGEVRFNSFDHAYSAVLDVYEIYLDALYDLTSEEIDELCWQNMMPRSAFDRNVKIAKLHKESPSEIQRGMANGKAWAFDPNLQTRLAS